MSTEAAKLPCGIIPRPSTPPIASALPSWRFKLAARYYPHKIWVLDYRNSFQLSLFLAHLRDALEASNIRLIDANLWFKGSGGVPTPYHSDLWFSRALENRVIQLWIPLMCQGEPEEIARSMVRLDPIPLEKGWSSGYGSPTHYTHLVTGEKKPFRFPNIGGQLFDDVEGAIGGRDLEVGDILFFDNAYCHYSLASQASRVGLAIRLCCGAPTYNGCFEIPGPMDNDTMVEPYLRPRFQGFRSGDEVPPEIFWSGLGQGLRFKLMSLLLLGTWKRQLHPILQQYVQLINDRLGQDFRELL